MKKTKISLLLLVIILSGVSSIVFAAPAPRINNSSQSKPEAGKEKNVKSRFSLVCILEEGKAYLYETRGSQRFLVDSTSTLFSGDLSKGPKRAEGDEASPWGRYYIDGKVFIYKDGLPAVKLNYPNEQDIYFCATGSDVLGHGSRSSLGCLSFRDTAFLVRVTQALALNDGEVIIFPSRMTKMKVKIWKEIMVRNYMESAEVEQRMSSLLELWKEWGTKDSTTFPQLSIKVISNHKMNNFGITENIPQTVDVTRIDTLDRVMNIDSIYFYDISEHYLGVTRRCFTQVGFTGKYSFDTLIIFREGRVVASFMKTEHGNMMSYFNTGTPEGVLIKNHFIDDVKTQSLVTAFYATGEQSVNPDEISFQEADFPKGFIITQKMGDELKPCTARSIKVIKGSEQKIFVRSAGRQGLYVQL